MIEQRFKPVRVDHFTVGGQQHQVLALRLLAGRVVQRHIAPGLVGTQHADFWMLVSTEPVIDLG
ncbi:hypothetical protein D3C81_1890930 [compost metagenome]